MKPIGEKIKELRKSKGISQVVMAEACGIKQSSYANIENGKTQSISIEVGKGIAKALNIPFGELFDIDGTGTDNQKVEATIIELQEKVSDLETRIKEKDLIVDSLKKEIREFKREKHDHEIFDLIRHIVQVETLIEKNDSDKKLRYILEEESQLLTEIIIESINEKLYSRKEIISFFLDIPFLTRCREKIKGNTPFIKKFTAELNKFFKVSEFEVEKFFKDALDKKNEFEAIGKLVNNSEK